MRMCGNMKEDLLTQLFELINNSEDIQINEIPEYHLYISQLEEFFDKKLKKSNGEEDERKTISKTMIQNYIKDGLLMPPEGKSYNSSHVILLTLIYNLLKFRTPKSGVYRLYFSTTICVIMGFLSYSNMGS